MNLVNQSRSPEQSPVAIRIVDYDESASFLYGELCADLEKRGQPIGPLDMMIAAHALDLDVPLVTNNTKEFERVKGMKVENWVE